MKIKWEFIVIVALLLLIIAGVIFWPKPQPSTVIIQARDSIERIQEANQVLLMTQRTLEVQLAEVRVKSSSDSARFYREITVKNQQLARKRVQIDTVFKDSPVLQDYLQTADSVFAMMHSRIDSLEASKAFQAGLYSDLIRIKDKQIQNLTYISGQQNVIIADQAKQLKKKSPKRLGNILKEIGKDAAFFLVGYGIGKGS